MKAMFSFFVFLLIFVSCSLGDDRFVIEDISFDASCDGTIQKYVRMLPNGFDASQSHDLIIGLHGHGSDRWQFVTAGEVMRNTAAKYNMIVVLPDYRATTSWMGPKAEADVLQIIEEVKTQYAIRYVIFYGGSMGGSSGLTFTALHPELVDGIVSDNGTANHLEFSNFQDAIAESFGGTKQQIPLEYKKRSAEYWPEQFTMPVAIGASGQDEIVPPQSVLRLADVLEKIGKNVKLIYSPNEGHSTPNEVIEVLFNYIITNLGIQTGPVAHYSLDDDLTTSTVVNSINTSSWGDAVAVNGGLSSGAGIVGNAFDFNDTFSAIDTGNTLNATGDFTLSAWVNLPEFAAGDLDPRSPLFGQYDTDQNGRMLLYASDGRSGRENGPRFFLSQGGISYTIDSDVAIDDGKWHNITLTRAGDVFTMYLDGTDKGSITAEGSLYQAKNLTIGNVAPDGLILSPGAIDEVLIYNEALSATDIQSLYSGYFFKFTETDGDTVVFEGQPGDSYSVSLVNQPTDDVVITATAGAADMDLGAGAGAPASLTFTPSNYSTPQNVIVSVLDDATDQGLRDEIISHSLTSSDAIYNGMSVQLISVQIQDNDAAELVFNDTGSLSVSEAQTTSDTYSVFLSIAPSSDVTVTLVVNEEITVSPSELTFTASDWNIPQVVTVTAVKDEKIEEQIHEGLIIHSISSDDTDYDGIVSDITVAVHDSNCGSWGYYPGDANHDCYVNVADIKMFATNWLNCSDPSGHDCEEVE